LQSRRTQVMFQMENILKTFNGHQKDLMTHLH
jgi:hypothetical protein